LDITFIKAEAYFDGSRRYDVFMGGQAVGAVRRDDRHVYRTNYQGERYGYDRSHSCWRIELPDGQYYGGCFRTRVQAAIALRGE
jgi:hypothetical protein